ncbi:helix-turn-helix transcriptional regulator [Brucella oryzae]|uniref:HTH luxR-type domain-containing protein n=1 Tax=Brucella oryzae TaxID=335286 RepID=A0A2S7IVD2_9HYPH|nr:LuxR C-terminal-related transcriptional regulator [Brucella oryzae]PQA71965.1 hypothetical protein C3731_19050 [Brucella oryzae]
MDGQLSKLVYAAMLGEETWEHFLGKLASNLPDGTAALVTHDIRNDEGYGLFAGFEETTKELYNSYYGKLNPLQPLLFSKPIGFTGYDFDLISQDNLRRTEFYNDFLVPQRMKRTAGVKFAKSRNQSFTLVISWNNDPIEPSRIEKTVLSLASLSPHLKRAFDFYQREKRSQFNSSSLMDTVNIGALVLDREYRPRIISMVASEMIENISPLRTLADGKIRFRQSEIQAASDLMLKRSYDGPEILDFYSHGTKLTLIHLKKERHFLYFEGPHIIVLLKQFKARSTHYDQKLFGAAFKLSRGEMRALAGIVDGQSINEIALEADRSKETIRSQFKSLYSKTGTRGEADILRLLHRGWQHLTLT